MGMQRGGGQSVLKSLRLSFVCRVSLCLVCCSESRWFQFLSKNATTHIDALGMITDAIVVGCGPASFDHTSMFTRSSKLFRGERAGPHTGRDHDPFPNSLQKNICDFCHVFENPTPTTSNTCINVPEAAPT